MMAVLPKVYLVSKPSIDWNQLAEFLADEKAPPIEKSIRAGFNDSEAIVEASARLCYNSYSKGRNDIKAFIDNLLKSKDGSVLEHVNYGFLITGISRSLSHEFVRHRAGFAYSQRSQRYVDESTANYVLPPLWDALDENDLHEFKYKIINAIDDYGMLVYSLENSEYVENSPSNKRSDIRKRVRSAARALLPNAMETKMFVTANVRAWRHFIEMRASYYADEEIRRLALLILAVLQKESPLLFGDFTLSTQNNITVATPQYSKV